MNMEYMYPHLFVLWLNILATVLLVGAVAFRSMVLNGALMVPEVSSTERTEVQAESQRRLRRWIAVCVILLVVVSVFDLVLRTQMMSRKPLSAVGAILPMVLVKSHIGKVWCFKMADLALFGLLWLFVKEQPRSGVQPLLLLASAGLCLSLTLSGHPADKGDFSLPVLADWTHLAMVSWWVGGLFSLRLLFPKLLPHFEKKNRVKFESAVLQRFSTCAVIAVSLLLLSGIYTAWLRFQTVSDVVSTSYGITLLFKLAFFLPLLVLGAINRYYTRPSLQRLAGEVVQVSWVERYGTWAISFLGGGSDEPDHRRLQLRYNSEQMAMVHLKMFVAVQCLVALVVLALATALTQTSPPKRVPVTAPGQSSGMTGSMDHSSMEPPSMDHAMPESMHH